MKKPVQVFVWKNNLSFIPRFITIKSKIPDFPWRCSDSIKCTTRFKIGTFIDRQMDVKIHVFQQSLNFIWFVKYVKNYLLQIDNFVRTKFMNYESNISYFDLEIQFPWFSLTVFRFKKIIVSSETWEFSDLWNLFKNTWFDYQKFVQTSTQSKLSMDWKNLYKFLFGRIIWVLFQGLSP